MLRQTPAEATPSPSTSSSESHSLTSCSFKRLLFHIRALVRGLSQCLLNEHEILTLGRNYGNKKYPVLSTLISLVQDDLKKQKYSDLTQLAAGLGSCDPDGVGFIEREKLRHVCHAVGVPLTDQLIDGTIMK